MLPNKLTNHMKNKPLLDSWERKGYPLMKN